MTDFMDQAKKFADAHEQQVEQGLERAAEEAEQRTDNKYDKQIDQGVHMLEEHIGESNQDK